MRSRYVLAFVLSSAVGGCVSASSAVVSPTDVLPEKAPGTYREALTFGGTARKFVLVVPKAYDASRRLPLVVLLHGWMGDANQILNDTGLAGKANREGFVLAAPEAMGDPKGWNAGFLDLSGQDHPDDAGFVSAVIDQAEREVGIDPDRLFVAGHSNGAMLAHLVGAKLSSRVAAVAAVSGTIGLPSSAGKSAITIPAPSSPVSVIVLHGQADPLVAYDETHPGLLNGIGAPASAKWWAEHDGCTPAAVRSTGEQFGEQIDTYSSGRNRTEVELVTYPQGAHLWPSDATDLIWKFFLAHPRQASKS